MANRAYALIRNLNVSGPNLEINVGISLYPIQGPFLSNQFERTYIINDPDALPAAIRNAVKDGLSNEAQTLGFNLTTANVFVSDLG